MDFKIICPYCGEKHDGLDYIETGDMDGSFETRCENESCDKEFTVTFETQIIFKTAK